MGVLSPFASWPSLPPVGLPHASLSMVESDSPVSSESSLPSTVTRTVRSLDSPREVGERDVEPRLLIDDGEDVGREGGRGGKEPALALMAGGTEKRLGDDVIGLEGDTTSAHSEWYPELEGPEVVGGRRSEARLPW